MPNVVSPYDTTGTWLRGNVHTHTTASDGDRPAENVIADYASRGYDFLAISDHDTFVDPEEYRDQTATVLLPAVEVSAGGPHLHHLGATEAVEPDDDRQEVVDSIADGEGFAVMNHPNWLKDFAHWPHEELRRVDGYAGVEIYNGLIERHAGSALATDRWDRLLSEGRRVWGFATDDSHRGSDVERGWTVVQVDERTPGAILDALATGRFYASTGVTIRDVTVDGGDITVSTADADRIRLVSDHGVVQQTADRSVATFRVPDQLVYGGGHTYVRVECVGRGGDVAWTQPMFLEE